MSRALLTRVPITGLLALILAFASLGCGSDGGGDEGGARDAKALLARTLARQVDSGDLELDLKADAEGVKSLENPMRVTLKGPFRSNGRKNLPALDWDFDFDGAGQKISGGVVVTRDNAFVELGGQSYEVGKDAFARLTREVRESRPDQEVTPAKLGLDPESWLEAPKVEDGEPIGGDATRKVTGSVDVRTVVRDVAELVDSPTVRKQLERRGQGATLSKPTDAELKEIEKAIEDVDVELAVDENDVLRRFAAVIRFNVAGEGDGGDDAKGTLDLAYVLRKVNTNPVINAPSNPRPLSELLGGLGLGGAGGLMAPRN